VGCVGLLKPLRFAEAKRLMNQTRPPDDPRLHPPRPDACAGLEWVEQATSEFDAANQAHPARLSISLEAHRNRGQVYVQNGNGSTRSRVRQGMPSFAPTMHACGDSRPRPTSRTEMRATLRTCKASWKTVRTKLRGTVPPPPMCAACVMRDDVLSDRTQNGCPLSGLAGRVAWGAGGAGLALYRASKIQEALQ